MVDLSIIRPIEEQALSAYMEDERTPIDILLPLSALSQMWVFSLYEFMRTWRQRASELLKLADTYASMASEEREKFVSEATEKLRAKRRFVRIGPEMHASYLGRYKDEAFVANVRDYMEKNEWIFREAEALRVTLAKHEIPKTQGLFAEAPGYGRMSYRDGAMYWHITLKDESQIKVDRRDLADGFLGIDPDSDFEFDDDGEVSAEN